MGEHDAYGKAVMQRTAGAAFRDWGAPIEFKFGAAGGCARIDGVVGDEIAVEIESRTSKQVRGAVLDLMLHPHRKKLLVLVPMHMDSPTLCSRQCEHILGEYVEPSDFRVVVLAGTGHAPAEAVDTERVRAALLELGFVANAA